MAMKIGISYRQAQRINFWETGWFVSDSLRKLGHEVIDYGFMYENNEWFCDKEAALQDNYDLLIWMDCGDPSPQYFELQQLKCPKLAWFFDVSYNSYQYKYICDIMRFDWVFSANLNYQQNFFGPKCSFLPYATSDSKHMRPIDTSKVIDVALIGSDRPDRRKLIQSLSKAGINAQLISGVFKEAYIDALASSKIIINENPSQGRKLLNMRFFETMAAGSCLLTQRGDGEDKVGIENQHFVCYENEDEAISKCGLLLDNETLRLTIATAGQDHVLNNHTYKNRVKTILDQIKHVA